MFLKNDPMVEYVIKLNKSQRIMLTDMFLNISDLYKHHPSAVSSKPDLSFSLIYFMSCRYLSSFTDSLSNCRACLIFPNVCIRASPHTGKLFASCNCATLQNMKCDIKSFCPVNDFAYLKSYLSVPLLIFSFRSRK